MRKEPNYRVLTIALLVAVVFVTSSSPRSLLSVLGVFIGALCLMLTAYMLTGHRLHLQLAVVFGASAFLPYAWLSIHPAGLVLELSKSIYALNLFVWLSFTLYIGLIVFRGIISAHVISTNEVAGAVYVYLLTGILFAGIYQLLLTWQPGALYFDPARFSEPLIIGNGISTRGAGAVLYYSFVTLGTVGYGDVTPASPAARSVSLVEMVVGIMYVATMIARLVSIQTSNETRGAGHAKSSQE